MSLLIMQPLLDKILRALTGLQTVCVPEITMVQLTPEQRIFVVKTYHETRSFQATQNVFAETFHDREPPTKKTIWSNVKKYEDHGTSLNRNREHSGRRRTARTQENIAAVRQQLAEHPAQTSARRNGVGLPPATFNRITRLDLHYHPYHMHIRHELLPGDLERRRAFCEWFLERCARNPRFLRYFVIGDEAAFAMNAEVNGHNTVRYAPARQPPAFNFETRMSREKLTVWLGLCGNGRIIGPFFFQRNVNGQAYLRMIDEEVVPQMELHFDRQNENGMFRYVWWAQDGAPAHRLIAVRERLRELFNERVIALHHPVEWPPRSPDLTPCDFFLWGDLKNKVFVTPPRNLQDLQQRIQHEVEVLRQNPGTIRRAVNDMRRRCQLCLEREGGHVEGIGQ